MSAHCSAPIARSTRLPRTAALGRRLLKVLDRWYDRWQQRRVLETLSDEALADLGLTPAQVREEAAKPFWQH